MLVADIWYRETVSLFSILKLRTWLKIPPALLSSIQYAQMFYIYITPYLYMTYTFKRCQNYQYRQYASATAPRKGDIWYKFSFSLAFSILVSSCLQKRSLFLEKGWLCEKAESSPSSGEAQDTFLRKLFEDCSTKRSIDVRVLLDFNFVFIALVVLLASRSIATRQSFKNLLRRRGNMYIGSKSNNE